MAWLPASVNAQRAINPFMAAHMIDAAPARAPPGELAVQDEVFVYTRQLQAVVVAPVTISWMSRDAPEAEGGGNVEVGLLCRGVHPAQPVVRDLAACCAVEFGAEKSDANLRTSTDGYAEQ